MQDSAIVKSVVILLSIRILIREAVIQVRLPHELFVIMIVD